MYYKNEISSRIIGTYNKDEKLMEQHHYKLTKPHILIIGTQEDSYEWYKSKCET